MLQVFRPQPFKKHGNHKKAQGCILYVGHTGNAAAFSALRLGTHSALSTQFEGGSILLMWQYSSYKDIWHQGETGQILNAGLTVGKWSGIMDSQSMDRCFGSEESPVTGLAAELPVHKSLEFG